MKGKIKKVVAVIFSVVMIGIAVIGCGSSKSEVETTGEKMNKRKSDFSKLSDTPDMSFQDSRIWDYIDPETGVHYLIYYHSDGGGITVRYNEDGSIMTDK